MAGTVQPGLNGAPQSAWVLGPGSGSTGTDGGDGGGLGRKPASWAWASPQQHSLEHGDEQVEQQDVREEQVQAEQDDRQPLGEDGPVPGGVTLRALGLVGVGAIGAALVQVEVHA